MVYDCFALILGSACVFLLGSFPERRAHDSGVRWSVALRASVADMKERSGAGVESLHLQLIHSETDTALHVLLSHLR